MPSSAGYLIGALAASIALFFALWWMFVSGGDEAPWIPAGLAASVVLLVALSAREIVMRRAWTRYLLEQGIQHSHRQSSSHSKRSHSTSLLSAVLRTIQKQSAEADAPGAAHDLHLDVFQLCRDYATAAEEALQSNNLPAEKRMALRTGQERARTLNVVESNDPIEIVHAGNLAVRDVRFNHMSKEEGATAPMEVPCERRGANVQFELSVGSRDVSAEHCAVGWIYRVRIKRRASSRSRSDRKARKTYRQCQLRMKVQSLDH
jgi:hypothetical protein